MQLGNLNLMILKSISKSEKYGLEIIDDITKETNGELVIKQPSLYSGLRRLEQRGLISSRWEDSDIGGRRHYYTITNLGKSELQAHLMDADNKKAKANADSTPTEDVVTQPNEIPTENIFVNHEAIKAQDEQTVSMLEQSFDEEETSDHDPRQTSLFEQMEKDLNISAKDAEPQQTFDAYEPTEDADNKHKSFSDTMRDYVEPENNYDEYKFQASDPVVNETQEKEEESVVAENTTDTTPTQSEATEEKVAPQDTVIEYVHASEDTTDGINYKDILGDLDADLNNTPAETVYEIKDEPIAETNVSEQQIVSEPVTTASQKTDEQVQERPKSAYEKELEQILVSSQNDDATHNITIRETDRMAEVNHKYGDGTTTTVHPDEIVEDETLDENIHKITSKDVGFTYLNQEDITVKPYKKANKKAPKTGLFLNVNKYNLVRASIMFILMALELALSYVICNANGLFDGISSTAIILYSVSAAIVVLYYAITLIYTLSNLSKKIKTENISFATDILYRFIMFAFIIMFVMGLNLFMGMPNTVSWLVPCIMTLNILISWIVGLIIYKTRAFHA